MPKLTRLLLLLYLLGGVIGADSLVWCVDQGGYAHLEQTIAQSQRGKLSSNPARFELYNIPCESNAGATQHAASLKHIPVSSDQMASAFGVGHHAAPIASSAVLMLNPVQTDVSVSFETAGEFLPPTTRALRTTVLLI